MCAHRWSKDAWGRGLYASTNSWPFACPSSFSNDPHADNTNVKQPPQGAQVERLGVSDGGAYQPRPPREMKLESDSLPVEPRCLPESPADNPPPHICCCCSGWGRSRLSAVYISSPSSPAPLMSSELSCQGCPADTHRQSPLHLLFIPRRVSGQLAHTDWEAHYCFIKD